MGQYPSFDPRALSEGTKTAFEAETLHRLNPYGPARPPTGQEPPTLWERMRQFWSRLRARWTQGRNGGDGAQGS